MFKRKYSFQLVILFYLLVCILSDITSPTTAYFIQTSKIDRQVTIEQQMEYKDIPSNTNDLEVE